VKSLSQLLHTFRSHLPACAGLQLQQHQQHPAPQMCLDVPLVCITQHLVGSRSNFSSMGNACAHVSSDAEKSLLQSGRFCRQITEAATACRSCTLSRAWMLKQHLGYYSNETHAYKRRSVTESPLQPFSREISIRTLAAEAPIKSSAALVTHTLLHSLLWILSPYCVGSRHQRVSDYVMKVSSGHCPRFLAPYVEKT
jgi:hypothetical protein